MTRVAIIACSNGLGHVRRTLLIAQALVRRDTRVTLFAPRSKVEWIAGALGLDTTGFAVTDFDTCSTAQGFRRGEVPTVRWIERLPDMDGFEIVLSDNLPEILERRPDAVLCGSFLWHEALDGTHSDYVANARRLLSTHRPLMLANSIFSPPYLHRDVSLRDIGFCAAYDRPSAPGNDLLIACGHGGDGIEPLFAKVVAQFLIRGNGGFRALHVEPRLMPESTPDWMRPADFNFSLYANLRAAICRPGMGTVTDVLISGARIFSLYEPGNDEMSFNARKLAELGLGRDVATPEEAVATAFDYNTDADARASQWQRSGTLARGGAETAARILLETRS